MLFGKFSIAIDGLLYYYIYIGILTNLLRERNMSTIIVGGGASALACAVKLKQNNPDGEVIVLERLSSPGRKLLATGNGRCNLSNTAAEHYREVIDFFSSIGLVTRNDGEGRIYPYSNRASTVVEVLLSACRRLGVEIITDCAVTEIDRDLTVTTNSGIFFADNAVIATGGRAQSLLGSNGSGYALLKALGHTINPTHPALVQLLSPNKAAKQLKGQRVKGNMKILLDGEVAGEEYGEILFTDYGLSGIVTMDLSEIVSRNFQSRSPKKCHAVIDIASDIEEEKLIEHYNKFGSFDGIFGSKLTDFLMKQSANSPQKAAHYAKNQKLIIKGTKGYDFAQITAGGAKTDEFDCFQSRLVPGLYACGEVLDRQFACGGFNLNFAFFSGITAADKICGLI